MGTSESTTRMSGPNRYEYAGRFDKAWKIVRYLERSGIPAETAGGWSDVQWEVAAGMVGVKAPSDRTIGIVLGIMAPAPHKR